MEQMGKKHFRGMNRCSAQAQKGFTLVEMAIVLAVIGLILGAVSIGKDVQRNAEYSKIKQKFIDQWVVAYNAHYQRTGVVVGDSQIAPRIMVNGANYAGTGGVISGGNMTAAAAPAAICSGAAGPGMARGMQAAAGGFDLHALMQRAGVRMPPGRAEGSEDRYAYLDSNGNPQELQVCFQWNPPGTISGTGDVMVITGLTPDLARYLDQTIDGKPAGTTGLFRQEAPGLTGTAASAEWSSNNSFAINAAVGAATTLGTNLDTNQVATVVAEYKMNQ